MNFRYKAVTETGKIIEGTFEGESSQEVLSMLNGNDYLPISIEETKEKKLKNIRIFSSSVRKKDIAIFCRQFYTMLHSGINIIDCLNILEKQAENKTFKYAIGQVNEDVQKGISLSQAMGKHEKVFSTLLVSMVEAGEASGTLEDIMERMAIHYEKENNIENKVKTAFLYPVILIIVSIAVVIFLLTVVMPTFINMFESSGSTLPRPTRLLLNMSYRVEKYWFIYIIIIASIVSGVKYLKKTLIGKLYLDTIKIKFPGIKKTNIKIITSRFTRTLSTLLSSGIPLIQTIEIVGKVVNNEVVKKGFEKGIENIQKGDSLSTIVKEIGVFPPMVYSMIKVGEESGSLDEILLRTADFYDEEVEVSLEKTTTMLEPILIVIMAFVIGFIVIAMAMPMFDMIDTI
ncbi:MAG TPA: type II secretion system F family protein [Tissierellales bacterium]|nr:type II secretion system F family protein [Tissierellales bacterium]